MKNKKNSYSVVLSLLVFAVTLLVCVSMFLPRNVGNVYQIETEPETVYGIENVEQQVNCELNSDGEYKILGVDPQLVFTADKTEIECIRVTIVSKKEEPIPFEFYTDLDGNGFSAEYTYNYSIISGEQSVVIDLPKGNYHFFRLDINQDDVIFKSIETFDEQPVSVPYKPQYSTVDYLVVVLVPVIFAVAVFFADCKFALCEKLCKNIAKNKIKILTVLGVGAAALLFAALVEMVITLILGSSFNVYRWILISGFAELIVTFISGYKCLKEKPENLFLPLILILGAVMLFGSPVKHIIWDLDSHYTWAVHNSYPGTTYTTVAYDCVYTAKSCWLWDETRDYNEDVEYLNEAENILTGEEESDFSLAHVPAGIFIAVSRFFGANFAVKYNMGRLANLIFYSIICYFAIKRIKSGKMILAVICLFPTNLFLATNYSYDWWVTSFTMLGTAYFVSELQEPDKPIKLKDTVIMAASFAIGALPKLVYVILMGMTLFMRKNQWSKKEKRTYYTVLISVLAILFLMFAVKSMTSIGGSGDSRGGDVNPSAQIAGILANPLGYAKTLSTFLLQYLSVSEMNGYISHFAYLGIGGSLCIIPITLLAFTGLTDADDRLTFKIPLYMKLLSILLLVGMTALIATALYIDFTPVGSTAIQGCQPRYIVPMLAPLMLLLTGNRVNLIENKTIYNGGILAISSLTVLAETYSLIITKMI